MKHRNKLLADDIKEQYSLNEKDIISAATLPELDDAYTRYKYNLNFRFKEYNDCLIICFFLSIRHRIFVFKIRICIIGTHIIFYIFILFKRKIVNPF